MAPDPRWMRAWGSPKGYKSTYTSNPATRGKTTNQDCQPRASAGSVNLVGGAILPSRLEPHRVKPDTEQSETVPRNPSNSTGECIPTAGVTQRGVEPNGSAPPRCADHPERAIQPTGLTSIRVDPSTGKSEIGPRAIRVDPNTVNSEMGPHAKSGSTMAVLDSNDASTNNVIIPMNGPCNSGMSMAVPNTNDTPTHDAIV
jgi:hypothetical protein